MASHPATTAYHQPVEPDSNVFFKVATMLLGILVAVVSFFALMMWADARERAIPFRRQMPPCRRRRITTRPTTTPPCH